MPRTSPSQTVNVPCAATATVPAAHLPSPPARLPRELHAPSTEPEDAGQSEHSAEAPQSGALPSGSEKSSAAVGRPATIGTHRSNCVANLIAADDAHELIFCFVLEFVFCPRAREATWRFFSKESGKGVHGRQRAPHVPSTRGSLAINVAPVIATRRLPRHLVSDLFPDAFPTSSR
jgi:hypothetical protein